MDEDIDVRKENVDGKLRDAVNSELTSFTNPQPALSPNIKSTSAIRAALEQKIDLGIRNSLGPNAPKTDTSIIKEVLPETPKPKPMEIPKAPVNTKPIIRTYKSDMEETIQAGHLSSLNMAVSENNRMMRQIQQSPLEEKKSAINKNVIILSFVLIAGGALAFLVPYLLVQKQNTKTTVATSTATALTQAIMTTDLEEKINLASINLDKIDVTLNERVNQSSTSLGQVKDFVLTQGSGTGEAPIAASDFLSLINASVPDEVSRSLLPQYMFGMYNYAGNQEFLILKVSSYDTTFSGMLLWEANLWQNFKNLFGLSVNTSSAQTNGVTSTSTSISSSSVPTNLTDQGSSAIDTMKFQDAQFDNQDCRVIKDASGKIIFLYSIINQNTIVIATSPDTLREIVSRINAAATITQ